MTKWSISLIALALVACDRTAGQPLDVSSLGYKTCEKYFDCGPGRYCTKEGLCWADCRSSADCGLVGKGPLCNLYGECVQQVSGQCTAHSDCGAGGYCNGRCRKEDDFESGSMAVCGSSDECPSLFEKEVCAGNCATQCGSDNDCKSEDEPELTCTPVARCLLPGWERWISPGEIPPISCKEDSQCLSQGFLTSCDCPKVVDPISGRERCQSGRSTCKQGEGPLDLGAGSSASPAHALRGVWGLRIEIAAITTGLPLVTSQNTYSSNLFLVKVRHTGADRLELTEKLCELRLLNFVDSDEAFQDIAWMVIPNTYLHSVALNHHVIESASAAAGATFSTDESLEVRGALLANPATDPLPNRHDFDQNPSDPRFFDQDEDGHVSMTTLMDGVLRGSIYNVLRWRAILQATVIDSDHVRGLAAVQSEQLVISASNPTLIYDIETVIHPDADRTFFRMQRLPDDATCADLIRLSARDDAWLRFTPHMMDVADP